MKCIIRLFLICIVSILTAQSPINIKSGIVTEMDIGDTVVFSQPLLIAFVKSQDSKWFTSFFIREESVFVEEMFYKPYTDKFTVIIGQQAIPFGANIPYFDITRFDPFTYQSKFIHDMYLVGRGISAYGDVGPLSLEGYYGSRDNEGYISGRASYWWKDYNIGISFDNEERKTIDANGFSKYVDYVAEVSKDYQWVRAIVKPGIMGVSLLAGYENNEVKSKPLYGVLIPFGEKRPSSQAANFVSAEFSGKGDVIVKVNCTFGLKLEGFSWKDLGFEAMESEDE